MVITAGAGMASICVLFFTLYQARLQAKVIAAVDHVKIERIEAECAANKKAAEDMNAAISNGFGEIRKEQQAQGAALRAEMNDMGNRLDSRLDRLDGKLDQHMMISQNVPFTPLGKIEVKNVPN